jgi:hypothetical protein
MRFRNFSISRVTVRAPANKTAVSSSEIIGAE